MVAIGDPIADDDTPRYEKPIPYSPLREPLSIARPRWVGFAELLILLVFGLELNTLSSASNMPNMTGAVCIGCALSLPPMLAAWSSIRSGVGRYALAVMLSLLSSFLGAWEVGMRSPLVIVLSLASAVPVVIALSVAKADFGRFLPLKHETGRFFAGLRFDLLQMFAVTTLLVVVVAVGKLLWPILFSGQGASSEALIVPGISGLISASTLMFAWAMLGQKMIKRICIAIPVSLVMLVSCNWLVRPDDLYSLWYTITGLPLIFLFLLMAAFRFSGWRFIQDAQL